MKLKRINNTNAIEIDTKDATILMSYSTPVAACIREYDDVLPTVFKWYRTSRTWSRTTSKHINQWIPKNVEVIEKPQEFFDGLSLS